MGKQVTQPMNYGVQFSLLQGNQGQSRPTLDGLRLQELWLVAELESALVYGEPRTSPFFFLSSDCMPTLWPWMVEMHSNCLQVLQLYPEGAVPGPCAALL